LLPTEYRADAVILFVDRKPVFGVILEAQLREDPDKRFVWPVYAMSARARYRCPFVVLVVTPDADTARWAAKTVDLGVDCTWRPLVVGPEGIPIITDIEIASRDPHLAVLSVMAHGRDDDVETAVAVAAAAAAGTAELPEPFRMLCFALIESSLGDSARKSFEMLPHGVQFFSERQRQYFAQGEAKGKAEGKAQSVLRVLERRGVVVSNDHRERILACSDVAMLECWLDAAVVATRVDELFG